MKWWVWLIIAAVIVGSGYYGVEVWINRQVAARAEALRAHVQVIEQEAAGLRQSLVTERENVTRARADVTKAKAATAQASKERDAALQSAIAAATIREAIHGQVATVPQAEVRGHVRAGLARLGLLSPVGVGR